MGLRILSGDDLRDLILGATVFGCGGGGSAEAARELAREALSSGEVRLAGLGALPGVGLAAIVGWVGGGVSPEEREAASRYPVSVEDPPLEAVLELSRHLGESPAALLASEIGPENTMVPIRVAAAMGIPVLDADACGRSKPEISISTTHVAGLPVAPLASVSARGDVVILERTADDYSAEDICRRLAVSAGGEVGVARCPTRISRLRGAVVEGSISRTMAVGAAVREARARGEDPAEAAARSGGGSVIFRGRISSWTREEGGGFLRGWVWVEGEEGPWSGRRMRVYYKNEFLVGWVDGEPLVSCPDALAVVDAGSGEGLSNWVEDVSENVGREVAVLAFPADPIWRTERGMEIFGPRRFGLDVGRAPRPDGGAGPPQAGGRGGKG